MFVTYSTVRPPPRLADFALYCTKYYSLPVVCGILYDTADKLLYLICASHASVL